MDVVVAIVIRLGGAKLVVEGQIGRIRQPKNLIEGVVFCHTCSTTNQSCI